MSNNTSMRPITRSEQAILTKLEKESPEIVGRADLVSLVGRPQDVGNNMQMSNTVDVHVKNLRRKLVGRTIETVRAVGYRLV